MANNTDETRQTTEISFCGYLRKSGLQMTACRRRHRSNGRREEFEFVFRDRMVEKDLDGNELSEPTSLFDLLSIAWANSHERKFDDEVRTVKKMIGRLRRNERGLQ